MYNEEDLKLVLEAVEIMLLVKGRGVGGLVDVVLAMCNAQLFAVATKYGGNLINFDELVESALKYYSGKEDRFSKEGMLIWTTLMPQKQDSLDMDIWGNW